MARRWIRLDVGWSDSDWVGALEPAARLAWVELLTYAKRDGTAGIVKALTPAAFGRKVRIPTEDVSAMLEAGKADGAIQERNGDWVITHWPDYQESDPTAKERMKRYRAEKSAHSPLRRNNRNTPSQPVTGGVTRRVTETETETETTTDPVTPPFLHAHTHEKGSERAAAVDQMLVDLSVEITNLNDTQRPRLRAAAKPVIEGEDRTAWLDPRTKGADPIPWPERPALFRLALSDCLSEGQCTQRALSGKVKYHALRQLDPHQRSEHGGGNGNSGGGTYGGRAAGPSRAAAPAAPRPGYNPNRRRQLDDDDDSGLDHAG